MGVAGSGKTRVGRALAESLGWPFHDADDFHPPANVAKMAAGLPLTDDDRWPWLDRIVDALRQIGADGGNAVLACSALRQIYRDRIARAGNVRFVYLKGDLATIAARLADRRIVAVRREDAASFPFAFRISGADAMMEGTTFAGPLEITARLSRSGDAVAARGDLEGVARGVAVGAKDARITLDTVHE